MKVMDTKRVRLLVVLSLLGGLVALSPLAPATADSGYCSDSYPTVTMQVVSGDFGLPLWLGFESGVLDGREGYVGLCYGTGAPGDSKTAGGFAKVEVIPWSNGVSVYYENVSDPNSANQNNFHGYAWPTYYTTTGGTGGGQSLTFTMPVAFCSGPCQPTTQPADGTSGVIVGTITQTPSGGDSASYRVDNLCVKVDGATVLGNCDARFLDDTGVTTTGTNPVNILPTTPGPCVVSLCAPNYEYIGTTGNQIATVYVPGFGTIPVYGVHTCLYTKDTYTSCPW